MTAKAAPSLDARVFALRAEGLTWEVIATRLGVSARAARKMFARHRAEALRSAAACAAPAAEPAPRAPGRLHLESDST